MLPKPFLDIKLERILKQISLTKKIPMALVREAVWYQFKMVKDTFAERNFKSIRLIYLGIFHVSKRKRKYYEYLRKIGKYTGGVEECNMEKSRNREDG